MDLWRYSQRDNAAYYDYTVSTLFAGSVDKYWKDKARGNGDQAWAFMWPHKWSWRDAVCPGPLYVAEYVELEQQDPLSMNEEARQETDKQLQKKVLEAYLPEKSEARQKN